MKIELNHSEMVNSISIEGVGSFMVEEFNTEHLLAALFTSAAKEAGIDFDPTELSCISLHEYSLVMNPILDKFSDKLHDLVDEFKSNIVLQKSKLEQVNDKFKNTKLGISL